MRSDQRLEQIGYEAGIPKPLFAIIHGDGAAIVWRWKEMGNFRDLVVTDPESLSDHQLREKLARKMKSGLTMVPVDVVIDESC